MPDYNTPGVYIEEMNAFPNSVVAVETAVPVFIGYTQKAERNGKSLLRVPTRISSLVEFHQLFGGAFAAQFDILDDAGGNRVINGQSKKIYRTANNELYFYSAIKFFYLNGGSNCYILPVGTYETIKKEGILKKHFVGDDSTASVFSVLEKEAEPTLVLLPDVVALKDSNNSPSYYDLYKEVLRHCGKMQSRFGIFDVAQASDGNNTTSINFFRESIGDEFLSYGAAYYPWLKTIGIETASINFTNIKGVSVKRLKALLPEDLSSFFAKYPTLPPALLTTKEYVALTTEKEDSLEKENDKRQKNINLCHQSLLTGSGTYKKIIAEISSQLSLMPPGSAIAGIYTMVDNSKGVWKAPANVAVAGVIAPAVEISSSEQESMNVDVTSGKSINVIRTFPSKGVLVWGARTLDGNSQDWRYINVRRTVMMIEQSLKLAAQSYVFEPNVSATWTSIKVMMENFLVTLWRQGALMGNKPEEAFAVQVGLGITMTANDILEGLLKVNVMLAIIRPAEFIIFSFQQQQQTT